MRFIYIIQLIPLLLFSNNFNNQFNSLVFETSPYLKQHKENPINWLTWNKKNLKKAKRENKLIFVSIGYSTCHWCHVMNKNSFNDIEIAKLLNENYISIKIDKEELPHIDASYQEIYKKITNERAGWPLNFILDKNKNLLFISKYIPHKDMYEVESFEKVLKKYTKLNKNKEELTRLISKNKNLINESSNKEPEYKKNNNLENIYYSKMKKRYDNIYKGFDRNPKFPLVTHKKLLLELSLIKNFPLKNNSYFLLKESLDKIANSGLYDYIDGGFYRYSIYSDWSIPHFEKMLYTQAELISLYSDVYNKTESKLYKNIIIKTIDFVDTRLKSHNSLYFSAIDADSLNNGNIKQEGFYYTYDYEKTYQLLEKNNIQNPEEILEYLGFDEFGNFKDEQNNIHLTSNTKPDNLKQAINILKKIRETKPFPFIDKKIILSWNSLYIESLFKASQIKKEYLFKAIKSLDILLKHFYINQQLYHQKFNKLKAKQKALLEDYSFLINTLLTAYQYTFEKKYLNLAIELNKETVNKFYKNKKWYADEEHDFEATFTDRYYVSAISKQFHNMITIANLTYDLELLEKTNKMIFKYSNKILTNIDSYPEAIRAMIRINKGDVILKSNKKNLLNNMKNIKKINYPFLLLKEEKTDLFLACDKNSCFKYDKDLKNIINSIENY